jgi:methylenetetrahydrofolate dehydrogenase (NADP+) / methenyltetrahydrofolate cyclohydrolase
MLCELKALFLTTFSNTMLLLDGNKLSEIIKQELKEKTALLMSSGQKRSPHLTAILVGNDGASQTYVNSKKKDCESIGFGSEVIRLPQDVSEAELFSLIEEVNNNPDKDGLIVQLPLPSHISESKVTNLIHPSKDVDGFTASNFGLVAKGEGGFIPATPLGILKTLEYYNIETSGKHCVVVGRSNIVGRPLSILMSQATNTGNATVTLCHSRTKDLKSYCKSADILMAAIGKPEFITADYVKEGAVVIDIGITRVEAPDSPKGYRLKGDVNFNDVKSLCSAITPVPGGVGPMTRVGLLLNTMQAYLKNNQIVSNS